jgi:glycosyltransferase involved in cell wall biosynthesis
MTVDEGHHYRRKPCESLAVSSSRENCGMSFSVLILTCNEERNLASCIQSVEWCDDIVVLDSGSSDATIDIAASLGARVVRHPFVNFAAQRNWALCHIQFCHSWVFHLDADERFTPELAAECRKVILEDGYSGFLVPSKMMLFGKWLRHAAAYPVYQTRLLKVGELWFEQVGHGQREASAKRGVGVLHEPYVHDSFNAGFDRWFEKHNAYSRAEAEQSLTRNESGRAAPPLAANVARFRRLKDLSRRMPCRPLAVWLYFYVLKRGFLDGRAGFTYCALRAIYQYMIDLKAAEIRFRRSEGAL